MIQYAVVQVSEDFVQCIEICTDIYQAIGHAYAFASDLVEDSEDGKGSVTPLFDLEGQTGMGLTVRYGENLEADIYILRHETDKKEDVMVEELRKVQEELDHRTQVEEEAVRLMAECRFDEATALLDTLDDAALREGLERLGGDSIERDR